MAVKNISIAGANSLLGQHLLARLSQDPVIKVKSLHDRLGQKPNCSLLDSQQWQVAPEVAQAFSQVPLLPEDATALAPILLSFTPDNDASEVEAIHRGRGTRIITHCEYARLILPMAVPGITPIDPDALELVTPNCTTAICALPLQRGESQSKISFHTASVVCSNTEPPIVFC